MEAAQIPATIDNILTIDGLSNYCNNRFNIFVEPYHRGSGREEDVCRCLSLPRERSRSLPDADAPRAFTRHSPFRVGNMMQNR